MKWKDIWICNKLKGYQKKLFLEIMKKRLNAQHILLENWFRNKNNMHKNIKFMKKKDQLRTNGSSKPSSKNY